MKNTPSRGGPLLALAGGADWIPAMAGSLHPPCRRKKLRPLRPRLTARTALCSVPSSSPHAAGRAGAPVFLARRKRENGPCTVQKRKRSIVPAGGRGTGARLNDWRSQNDYPRAIGSHGGCSSLNGPAPLFAAAPRWFRQFPVYRPSFSVRAR